MQDRCRWCVIGGVGRWYTVLADIELRTLTEAVAQIPILTGSQLIGRLIERVAGRQILAHEGRCVAQRGVVLHW